MRFRRRGRGRTRRGMVRRGGVGAIGRARTRYVNCLFESELMEAATLAPSAGGLGSFNTYSYDLKYWQNNSGGSQAVMYACRFRLGWLSGNHTNYAAISALYDYVKLRCVDIRLFARVNPRVAVNVSNQAAGPYNFTTWPGQDPIIVYTDYDGWSPMVNVAGQGQVNAPANGDMTQFLLNKQGARRYKPWGNVFYRFYPKHINLIATEGTTPQGSPELLQAGRVGWLANASSNAWFGQVIIAYPYLGENVSGHTNVDEQVNAVHTISNKWYLSFKQPLYG